MNRDQNCFAGVILALFVVLVPTASSDEVDVQEFMDRLRAALYTNVDRGIVDLQLEVRDPAVQRFPGVGSAEVVGRFYWKPERGLKVVLENLPVGAASMAGQIRSYLEQQWFKHVMIVSVARDLGGFRLEVEEQGSQYRLLGQAARPAESEFTEVEMEFNRNLRPLRRSQKYRNGGTLLEEFSVERGREPHLIDSVRQQYRGVPGPDGRTGDFQVVIQYRYEKVGDRFFPGRISASGGGQNQVVTFRGYKVNEGFDDSIYDR